MARSPSQQESGTLRTNDVPQRIRVHFHLCRSPRMHFRGATAVSARCPFRAAPRERSDSMAQADFTGYFATASDARCAHRGRAERAAIIRR